MQTQLRTFHIALYNLRLGFVSEDETELLARTQSRDNTVLGNSNSLQAIAFRSLPHRVRPLNRQQLHPLNSLIPRRAGKRRVRRAVCELRGGCTRNRRRSVVTDIDSWFSPPFCLTSFGTRRSVARLLFFVQGISRSPGLYLGMLLGAAASSYCPSLAISYFQEALNLSSG